MQDTTPGLADAQDLWRRIRAPGPAHPVWGGTADPIRPTQKLKPFIPLTGGNRPDPRDQCASSVSPGRTPPRSGSDTDNASLHGLPTLVAVHEGFYSILIPHGIGHFQVVETGAGHFAAPVSLHQ